MSHSYRYQYAPWVKNTEKIILSEWSIQKEIFKDTIWSLVDQVHDNDVIMCHESYVNIIEIPFFYHNQKALTTTYMLDIVKSSIPTDTTFVYDTSIITDICINNQKEQYCIGKHGSITCQIKTICIDSTLYHTFKSKKITFYPQSLATISYCNHMITSSNYCILYLYEQSLKLIKIKDHFIDTVHYLNIGIHHLRKIYQEQDIYIYFDKDLYDPQLNDFVKQIIQKANQFYVQQIIQRIQECCTMDTVNCYCICDTSNHFFKQYLTQSYHHNTSQSLIYINHIAQIWYEYTGHLIDIWLYHDDHNSKLLSPNDI